MRPLFLAILSGAAFLFVASSFAVVLRDGKEYTLGTWGEATEMVLASEKGPVRAQKRVLPVSRDNGRYREDYNLELISSKELNCALLTSSTASIYFISGGRITAVNGAGSLLAFKFGLPKLLEPDSPALAEEVLKLILDPGEAWDAADLIRYDVRQIFGPDILGRYQYDAAPRPLLSAVRDVTFQEDKLTVGARTIGEIELTLTLDPDFNLVAASRDGKPVRLLLTGRLPNPAPGWSWPLNYAAITPTGNLIIPGSSCSSLDIRALWSLDGSFWVGPPHCKFALVARKIVGFTASTNASLKIYDVNSKVPPEEGPKAFEDALQQATTRIANGLLPDAKVINLQKLFPDLPLADDPDLRVRSIAFSAEKIAIQIKTNSNRRDLFVLIDPSLSVISSRVIPLQ
jgi:hypothetical protein